MVRRFWTGICAVVLLLGGMEGAAPAAGPVPVVVFAAASTTNAVTEIGDRFAAAGFGKITPSFASSSTLAKQIENGAPAGVYISADERWMDYLEERQLIVSSSRCDLLSNRMVLIAPYDSRAKVEIRPGFDLATLLGDGRLAMGDPDHVPAGTYGQQALAKLGAWNGVKGKVARAKDVRAALALVERGETPLGIVYATDAAVTKKVRVVAFLPEGSHPPVVYPAALIAGNDTETAKVFLAFLKSSEAKAIFREQGFTAR